MGFQKVAVILVASFYIAHGAQILGLFPFPGKSHMIVNSALMKELARRGHQVTVMSFFPESQPIPNLTDIYLGKMEYKAHSIPGNMFDLGEMSPFAIANMLFQMGVSMTDTALQSEGAVKLINSEDHHFDLVIMEAFFNEAFLGYAHKFNASIVQLCLSGGTHWMGDWVGNPNVYSFVPDIFLGYGDKMTFWERLVNTVVGTYWRMGRAYYYLPKQDAVMKKHFKALQTLPHLSDLERSTSLILLNNHFSLSAPRPLLPSMVQVGGLHVKPPNKLPQDLQKFLDEATEGAIYFSMGSNLQSSHMSEPMKRNFLHVFSKLKQRVLWKFEEDTLPGQPKNVKLGKWLPQSDILAHPNIRLFITHGGLLSTQEATSRGIPVIGIPIYADQKLNILRVAAAGYGVLLEFNNITEESLSTTIREVIKPRYRENAQRLSRIYRDQPLSPLDQAVFWTEYVIRHKGAPHLRSAALDLAWYQYFLLDVIVVLAVATGIPLFILFLILRKMFRLGCSRYQRLNNKKKSQ
ncbi:UDP-glycosyltransferase UGT5-like [Periplaneta americana]|uniref:UDP-glycosyltransferase UGT5-like n=1 Tax=Periplaneta americana TaxID=6978 RepID=UPI0037E7798E